jgi:hypothetical protein
VKCCLHLGTACTITLQGAIRENLGKVIGSNEQQMKGKHCNHCWPQNAQTARRCHSKRSVSAVALLGMRNAKQRTTNRKAAPHAAQPLHHCV